MTRSSLGRRRLHTGDIADRDVKIRLPYIMSESDWGSTRGKPEVELINFPPMSGQQGEGLAKLGGYQRLTPQYLLTPGGLSSHSGSLLALLFQKRAEDRLQSLVAAGEQHHIRDVDGRPPGMPNRVIRSVRHSLIEQTRNCVPVRCDAEIDSLGK